MRLAFERAIRGLHLTALSTLIHSALKRRLGIVHRHRMWAVLRDGR